jgi:hypothetical protein
MERQPDTVTFTFETVVDFVVDLRTGEVKRESRQEELTGDAHFVALFCEGEWAGEADLHHRKPVHYDSLEDGDEEIIDRASDLLNVAFHRGTVKGEER